MLTQVAAAAEEFEIVEPLASQPSVGQVMYLQMAVRTTALADAASSPQDFPTEPPPVPGSPVLAVEALPPSPLAVRQLSLLGQTPPPEPDANPHREHVHGSQIGDPLSILDAAVRRPCCLSR